MLVDKARWELSSGSLTPEKLSKVFDVQFLKPLNYNTLQEWRFIAEEKTRKPSQLVGFGHFW